jgi:nitroreductase
MDALECIHTRRSVRTFEARPLPQDMIDERCTRPWPHPAPATTPLALRVVDEPGPEERLSHVSPNTGMLARRPWAWRSAPSGQGRYKTTGSRLRRATQNLLLAARAQGLGAVWLGVHPVAERKSTVRSPRPPAVFDPTA